MRGNEAHENCIIRIKPNSNFKLKTLLTDDSEERQVRNTVRGLQTRLICKTLIMFYWSWR